MNKLRIVNLAASAAFAVLSAQAAKNKDWYVSADMQYGRGIVPDENCTGDLLYAVTNCSAKYTVWVKDGFVCNTGSIKKNSANARIYIAKNITVRSESGCVDESAGKGAKIIGATHSAETPFGSASVRCVDATGENAKLIGFVLEGGCTPDSASYPGGGVLCDSKGTAMISNCVVRNCIGLRGGGIARGTVCHCIITNNTATGIGGGAYNVVSMDDSVVADNVGGGIGYYDFDETYTSKVVRCSITRNSLSSGNGGGVYCGRKNTSAMNVFLYECGISNNVAGAHGGGVSGNATASCEARLALFDCVVSGNQLVTSNSDTQGAGTYRCDLTRCNVVSNVTLSGTCGGCALGTLVNCRVIGNVVTNSTSWNAGGGVLNCNCYNTLFCGNFAWKGGGGYYSDSDAYNQIVNCTFVGNDIEESGAGAFRGAGSVVNTIAWGNTKLGAFKNTCTTCTDSCVEALDAETSERVFATDPRLDVRSAPKSSKCRNKALPFDWMTDPNDPRSKDVYGVARVQGAGPDLGAVEQPDLGFILLFR